MNRKTRSHLYRFFIFLFCVITIYTSLYATGYQINWRGPWRLNRLLTKTGAFALDSNPQGASIYIDEKNEFSFSLISLKKQVISTPAKIKNLKPGEYDLRLEKEGYWPWEKKLNIRAEETTYAENINLFKKSAPLALLECGCQDISLSPNRKYLLLIKAKKIINLKNGQEFVIDIKESIQNNQWIGQGEQILVNNLLIDTKDNTQTDYGQIIGNNAQQLRLDQPSSRLYYRHENAISYFDLSSRQGGDISNGEEYLDYYIKDGTIFSLIKKDKLTILKSRHLNTGKENSISLPRLGDYRLLSSGTGWLTVYDQKNRTLYILDASSLKPAWEPVRGFKSGAWIKGDQLLYYSDFEISLLDLKQNNNLLITRVGSIINDLIWEEKNSYIIFSTAESINTLDFSNNNITTLLRATDISSIFLDDKESLLYFTAEIDNKSGLYKMAVQ